MNPPGHCQGGPHIFNFHWPPAVFLTAPICVLGALQGAPKGNRPSLRNVEREGGFPIVDPIVDGLFLSRALGLGLGLLCPTETFPSAFLCMEGKDGEGPSARDPVKAAKDVGCHDVGSYI